MILKFALENVFGSRSWFVYCARKGALSFPIARVKERLELRRVTDYILPATVAPDRRL